MFPLPEVYPVLGVLLFQCCHRDFCFLTPTGGCSVACMNVVYGVLPHTSNVSGAHSRHQLTGGGPLCFPGEAASFSTQDSVNSKVEGETQYLHSRLDRVAISVPVHAIGHFPAVCVFPCEVIHKTSSSAYFLLGCTEVAH